MSSRRQREVLSPIVTTPNVPPLSLSQIISPSTNRLAPTCSPSTLLMEQQDDEKERRARRRSRVMELQRKQLRSPSSPADTDRRKSLPLSGLTTAQLTDHYTSCIKLSAENKINAKNAFGLHLIDYMSELLKKKELENFQVASTTLDASAKIYAGRVDAIHAETFKVLSGLGRGAEKSKQTEEDVEAAEGAELEGEQDTMNKQKKKKKMKKRKTVETNLKNLNVNKFDLEFEVDPLFHLMSAAFDEGGSSGLLLNNLRSFDKTHKLILDSNTLVCPVDDPDTSRLEERQQFIDLPELKESLGDGRYKNLNVCPSFSSFRFTNWDSTEQSAISVPGASDHRFDMDAEPEPIPSTDDNMGGGDDNFADDMDIVEDMADTNVDDNEELVENCIGDGKAAQLVQSVLSDMTHGTTGALMQVLATEPSDYSYFSKTLLRTWAGPAHWRAGNLFKVPPKSITGKSQKSVTKKPVFRIDFDEEIDFQAKHFKPSKYTSLTKAALSKYSKDQTTLPKDHHYDADQLFRLFMLKRKMIKRQTQSADVDDEIENYDYENKNDRENYCPNDDADDDNDSGEMEFGNFTAAGADYSEAESSSQDPFSQSQDVFTAPNHTVMGDTLLAQPYKVAKIDIDYAKTAKKLDVKRLKSSMWNLMKSAPKQTTEPVAGTSQEDGGDDVNNSATTPPTDPASDPAREMEGTLTFQQLLTSLPDKVAGQTARNLSVPIAFVCLLHLANEKTLKIEEVDMQDLKITQGL